jgi:UDP-N-acetylglucosamine:LPS N-acetylglucosamine transferase
LEILYEEKIENYFQRFNLKLRKVDILWTKPSELSFYSALGIPIICTPPLGSQEEFNLRWLIKSGFGILQENPKYTKEWLFDWIKKGYLAEMAMEAFVEGEKFGTFNIERIIKGL